MTILRNFDLMEEFHASAWRRGWWENTMCCGSELNANNSISTNWRLIFMLSTRSARWKAQIT
jgi:hypothetical protein